MSRSRRRHRRTQALLLDILWWASLTCFVLCAGVLLLYQVKVGAEAKGFAALANSVGGRGEQTDTAPAPLTDEQVLEHYRALAQQNPDLVGWLQLEGTKLDYPVVQTPREPEYYLRRDFSKNYSLSGTPFADAACDVNADSANLILYGHNMKNGTMFAAVEQYKQREYWERHPALRFDTLEARAQYDVLGVVVVDTAVTNPNALDAYRLKTGGTQQQFEEYIAYIKENALYDTGVSAQYGDSLLTLSTCTNVVETERIVLVAVRQAPRGGNV